MRKVLKVDHFQYKYKFHLSGDCGWYRIVLIDDELPLDLEFECPNESTNTVDATAMQRANEIIKAHQLMLDTRRRNELREKLTSKKKALVDCLHLPTGLDSIGIKARLASVFTDEELNIIDDLLASATKRYEKLYSEILTDVFNFKSLVIHTDLREQLVYYIEPEEDQK